MVQREVQVKYGLNLDTSFLVCRDVFMRATRFDSDITISINGRQASAKDLDQLIALDAPRGSVVTLTASGPDEKAAFAFLSPIL